jgi:hypothetical protein
MGAARQAPYASTNVTASHTPSLSGSSKTMLHSPRGTANHPLATYVSEKNAPSSWRTVAIRTSTFPSLQTFRACARVCACRKGLVTKAAKAMQPNVAINLIRGGCMSADHSTCSRPQGVHSPWTASRQMALPFCCTSSHSADGPRTALIVALRGRSGRGNRRRALQVGTPLLIATSHMHVPTGLMGQGAGMSFVHLGPGFPSVERDAGGERAGRAAGTSVGQAEVAQDAPNHPRILGERDQLEAISTAWHARTSNPKLRCINSAQSQFVRGLDGRRPGRAVRTRRPQVAGPRSIGRAQARRPRRPRAQHTVIQQQIDRWPRRQRGQPFPAVPSARTATASSRPPTGAADRAQPDHPA